MAILNFRYIFLALLVLAGLTFSGCRPKTKVLTSPPNYDFSKYNSHKLDLSIQEISGITWDAKNDIFYAINDEYGKLYTLDKTSKAIINKFDFGSNGDYEDVAIFKDTVYILRSDGTIFKFINDNKGNTSGVEVGKVPVSGTNDFETMYSDTARNALVVICKNCSGDDSKSVSAYAYYPDSIGFDKKPFFKLDAEKIALISADKSSKFQPSAAAIHPKLNKLFILSSASHQLIVANLNGEVESVHRLAPKLFLQPEGITFKNNGDMFISNEGLGSEARLLEFGFQSVSDIVKEEIVKTGYSLSSPDEKMDLGKHLKEISGMAYIPRKDKILAENDEKGDIFTIDFTNKIDLVNKEKFGGKGDYEDMVYTDSAVYMLISSGIVSKVFTKDSSFTTTEFDLKLDGKNEFEAMYLDADGKSLILLCKDCSKEKNKVRNAYRFDLVTEKFVSEKAYTIDVSTIQDFLKDEKAEFKPSAAGINPLNGKLYIVASVGKLMVIATIDGVVDNVVKLDPVLFNQPEGLTFAPNGDLYISNEGGEGVATILKFVNKN